MAEEKNSYSGEGEPYGDKNGKAELTQVSLSQAILSPLDALFKAQLHGARSFLNYLMQLAYRGDMGDEPASPEASQGETPGSPPTDKKDTPWDLHFKADKTIDGVKKRYEITIPALALAPVQPLIIDTAEYELEMKIESIFRHRQVQKSRTEKTKGTPWYLVSDPISIRGVLSPMPGGSETTAAEVQHGTSIKIKVNVSKAPMPAGLSKLLTSLTEMADIEPVKKSN